MDISGMDDEGERAPLHRRLHTLQSKLLVLGYKEHVGTESIELIERLFEDLVTTSESYERLQSREDRVSHDLALAQVGRGREGGREGGGRGGGHWTAVKQTPLNAGGVTKRMHARGMYSVLLHCTNISLTLPHTQK